jgi:hypothetical protein
MSDIKRSQMCQARYKTSPPNGASALGGHTTVTKQAKPRVHLLKIQRTTRALGTPWPGPPETRVRNTHCQLAGHERFAIKPTPSEQATSHAPLG